MIDWTIQINNLFKLFISINLKFITESMKFKNEAHGARLSNALKLRDQTKCPVYHAI